MKNKTSLILDSDQKEFITWKNYIPSVLSAFFSVFFSISIVFELKNVIGTVELVVFGLFILFFLIFNEKIKFKELNNKFKNQKYNLFTLLFTFMLSIGLSSIGIFFWTNKSTEIKNKQTETVNTEIAQINVKYNTLISAIENKSIDSYPEFTNEKTNLQTWKKRYAVDNEERKVITANIEKTQSNLQSIQARYNDFKQNEIVRLKESLRAEIGLANIKYSSKVDDLRKNDLISYLFIFLTLIVEFATISFNRELSKAQLDKENFINSDLSTKFKIYYKILYGIFTSKTVDEVLDINDIKYSPVNTLPWVDVKTYFNLLQTLKIIKIYKESNDSKEAKAKILLNETDALNKLNEYYNRILN